MNGEDIPVKVYLAVSGEYSDYRVQHVFTRREDAEAYPLGDDVEERELRDGPVEVRHWYTLTWQANRPDEPGDGFRLANPHLWDEQRDFDGDERHIVHRWNASEMFLRVQGWDRRLVHKVYSEQRAQYLARSI